MDRLSSSDQVKRGFRRLGLVGGLLVGAGALAFWVRSSWSAIETYQARIFVLRCAAEKIPPGFLEARALLDARRTEIESRKEKATNIEKPLTLTIEELQERIWRPPLTRPGPLRAEEIPTVDRVLARNPLETRILIGAMGCSKDEAQIATLREIFASRDAFYYRALMEQIGIGTAIGLAAAVALFMLFSVMSRVLRGFMRDS
jgi:hypothetical protein